MKRSQHKSIGASAYQVAGKAHLVLSGKRGCLCWRLFRAAGLSFLLIPVLSASAQTRNTSAYFAPENSLGIFGAYSNDSSHILLGDAEQRKLVLFGISYTRSLKLSPKMNWQYSAEFMPVSMVGDPLIRFVNTQTSPKAGTATGTIPSPTDKCNFSETYDYIIDGVRYSGTETITCYGRRWTMGEAMSPFGMQLNFLPGRNLQPFVIGHGGYMYSTRPVPDDAAGSFNFVFDTGAGLEYFLSTSKSVRMEYRYRHFSNAESARSNPGVDNGVIQVTYSFWP